MYRWFIAYRYLFSRITTFMALVVVAFGVGILILIFSVMEGFRSEMRDRIRGTSSEIKVQSTRYIDLEDPDRVAAIIETVPGVRATAPYVETLTLYRDERELFGTRDFEERYLRVVDLDRELLVGDLAGYVEAVGIPGLPTDPKVLFSREWNEKGIWRLRGSRERPYSLGGSPPPVLLGKEALRRELLRPGDSIRLTAYSPGTQQPCSGQFQVAGYFKTGLYELDSKGIIMEREAARDFLGLETPRGKELASGVRVAVEPGYSSESALNALRDEIARVLEEKGVLFVRVLTWQDEQALLLNTVLQEKVLTTIIMGMIVLFSGFMIFIILTLQVVEKTRDIGILQSMGASAVGIASIYFAIGATICISGTLVGTVWGVTFAFCVNTIQRWLKLLTGLEVFPPDVYYLDRIPVKFQPVDLAIIIGFTVVVSLLASVVPAYRAARRDPVSAIRYE